MKKIYAFLVAVAAVLTISSENVSATHFKGGNITYQYQGPNQYLVTLTLYRNCGNAAGLGTTAGIQWESPSGCGGSGYATAYLIPGSGNEVMVATFPPCGISSCQTDPATGTWGTGYGVEEYIYTALITLPGPCPDWTFSYSSCCRNGQIPGAITTISNPGSESIYIETLMDNQALGTDSNSSPVFAHYPVATFCVGRTFNYDQGATDVNGDSLVYSLVDALGTGPFAPVPYIPPYSGTNPILSSPPVAIDPLTGVITFTPTQVEVGILAILVEEYRRDTVNHTPAFFIGSIRRDMQVNIEAVCNTPPSFDTIVAHLNHVTAPCGDSSLYIGLDYTVKCNTLAPDGSDFRLISPAGIPILIKSANYFFCSSVGLTDSLRLRLVSPLCENGLYALVSKKGYDGNTLLNGCDLALAEFDTLFFNFVNCPPQRPDMVTVSVDPATNNQINLTWNVVNGFPPALFQSYDIFRSSDGPTGLYQQIGSTYSLTDTNYHDNTINASDRAYSYGVKVRLKNCFVSHLSDSIQSIHLTCSANADSISFDLDWSDYWGFANPTYQIWLDDGLGGTFSYSGNSTSTTSYPFPKPSDLGSYRVRIYAVGSGLVSISNWCDIEVPKDDVIIPNVITPNNDKDGLNEVFEIQNLYQYEDSHLFIYDRWGRKVYENEHYGKSNNWNGGGLEDGTYYYVLKVSGRKNFERNGTLNIFNK